MHGGLVPGRPERRLGRGWIRPRSPAFRVGTVRDHRRPRRRRPGGRRRSRDHALRMGFLTLKAAFRLGIHRVIPRPSRWPSARSSASRPNSTSGRQNYRCLCFNPGIPRSKLRQLRSLRRDGRREHQATLWPGAARIRKTASQTSPDGDAGKWGPVLSASVDDSRA